MEEHQKRVVSEKLELGEKIIKLDVFLKSDLFKTVNIDEQDRLKHQFVIMREYENVLTDRILNF